MIDEKKCYFFGRNKDVCDFVIDHASCSRVHAVLLWHKDLNRSFIVDMNSSMYHINTMHLKICIVCSFLFSSWNIHRFATS